MPATAQKLDAVIAALTAVRDHVGALGGEDVEVAGYNRWIGLLNGVVQSDWDSLVLDGGASGTVPAAEMLMNIEAAIAFLEDYREAPASVAG